MSAKHIVCGPFANQSERTSAEYLMARLNGLASVAPWHLLTNVTVSAGAHSLSDEVDMIVVGPMGIDIIEIKHWDGAYLKSNVYSAEHEADKVNAKAKKIAGRARKYISDIGFVRPKLLLTKVENEKYQKGQWQTIRGVEVYGLSEWRNLLNIEGTPILDQEQIQSICRALVPEISAALDGSIRAFAEFVQLVPLSGFAEGFHRIYRGRHKTTRDKVVLHLYDLSATKEKTALDVARREFDVLQKTPKIALPA